MACDYSTGFCSLGKGRCYGEKMELRPHYKCKLCHRQLHGSITGCGDAYDDDGGVQCPAGYGCASKMPAKASMPVDVDMADDSSSYESASNLRNGSCKSNQMCAPAMVNMTRNSSRTRRNDAIDLNPKRKKKAKLVKKPTAIQAQFMSTGTHGSDAENTICFHCNKEREDWLMKHPTTSARFGPAPLDNITKTPRNQTRHLSSCKAYQRAVKEKRV